MTPEKFFDYLEGKLPPAERERLERALITDPELQQQFHNARQIHRGLQTDPRQSSATTRSGNRGRQLAAAFAVLVVMNVALGLIYIFKVNKPDQQVQHARQEALRHQLQSSIEKQAAATFTPPVIGMETIKLPTPQAQQAAIGEQIIATATAAGGSGTKTLPNDKGLSVLVVLPGKALPAFRQTLTSLGAPAATDAGPTPAPDELVRMEVALTTPP